MRSLAVAALSTLLFSACAAPTISAVSSSGPVAVGKIPGPTWTSHTVVYQCQQGTKLQVAYLDMKSGESFASLHYNGNTVLLQSRQLTAGVRYIALDEQNSLRWATKGGTGFLAYMAADHTAKEQILLSDCKSISAG